MIQNIMNFCRAYGAKCLGGLFGGILALWMDNIPFIMTCTAFVLVDFITAIKLARRVHKKYGDDIADGKFKSRGLGGVVKTLGRVYTFILLSLALQKHVMGDPTLINVPAIMGCVICGWQFASILENSASCNGAPWARIALMILADKTERHVHISLEDFRRLRKTMDDNILNYIPNERENNRESDVSNDMDGQV